MARKRLCERCRKPVGVGQLAAQITIGNFKRVWCLVCWDDNDEEAVAQYRAASMEVAGQ